MIIVVFALLSCSALCIGTSSAALLGLPEPRILVVTFILGWITVFIGIILRRRERRSETYNPSRSFGLLYVGIGLFAMISTVLLPVIPTQFTLPPPVRPVTATTTPSHTIVPTLTPRELPSATAIPSPTETVTPLPTLTLTPPIVTPERPTHINSTLTLTPTTADVSITPTNCTVKVGKNVNLRAMPSVNATLITTIPFDTVLPVLARTADKSWWQVNFKGRIGWVSGQFVTPTSDCARIPTASAP